MVKNILKHHWLLLLLLGGITVDAKAQSASVEKSLFGIQTGFAGIWGHHEAKLSDPIALRTELGMETGMWGGDFHPKTGFMITPVVTLEPRWYYNLTKRARTSKRMDGNSGNFLSLKTTYRPDWFVISNYDAMQTISDISIIPTWGIRRPIGRHFHYETGIGMGYRYVFTKQAGYSTNQQEVALQLHLRIGYKF